jgi:hypothetical protein
VACRNSSFHFGGFWCSEPLIEIITRTCEKSLAKILTPMMQLLAGFGWNVPVGFRLKLNLEFVSLMILFTKGSSKTLP